MPVSALRLKSGKSRERGRRGLLRLPHLPQMDIGCLFHQNPHQKAKPAESQLDHDLKNVALGRSVGGFKPTPSSSPSPAPPENSPTASERAEGSLQLQSFLRVAASDSADADECRSVRGRLVKREEPSLIRSDVKPPGDGHFWPIFAGADGEVVDPGTRGSRLKRDAPYRMLDAPFSGVGIDDGAEGECRLCGLR